MPDAWRAQYRNRRPTHVVSRPRRIGTRNCPSLLYTLVSYLGWNLRIQIWMLPPLFLTRTVKFAIGPFYLPSVTRFWTGDRYSNGAMCRFRGPQYLKLHGPYIKPGAGIVNKRLVQG